MIVSNAEWKQVRAFRKTKMQHFVVLSHPCTTYKCSQFPWSYAIVHHTELHKDAFWQNLICWRFRIPYFCVSAETILFWKWKMWKFSYSFHIMADFVKHFWDNAFENFEGKFHETFWTILQYLSIILIPQPSLTRLFTFQSYC